MSSVITKATNRITVYPSICNFYNEAGVLVYYISTKSNIIIFWVNVPKNVIKMSPPVNAWVIAPQGCK